MDPDSDSESALEKMDPDLGSALEKNGSGSLALLLNATLKVAMLILNFCVFPKHRKLKT